MYFLSLSIPYNNERMISVIFFFFILIVFSLLFLILNYYLSTFNIFYIFIFQNQNVSNDIINLFSKFLILSNGLIEFTINRNFLTLILNYPWQVFCALTFDNFVFFEGFKPVRVVIYTSIVVNVKLTLSVCRAQSRLVYTGFCPDTHNRLNTVNFLFKFGFFSQSYPC